MIGTEFPLEGSCGNFSISHESWRHFDMNLPTILVGQPSIISMVPTQIWHGQNVANFVFIQNNHYGIHKSGSQVASPFANKVNARIVATDKKKKNLVTLLCMRAYEHMGEPNHVRALLYMHIIVDPQATKLGNPHESTDQVTRSTKTIDKGSIEVSNPSCIRLRACRQAMTIIEVGGVQGFNNGSSLA